MPNRDQENCEIKAVRACIGQAEGWQKIDRQGACFICSFQQYRCNELRKDDWIYYHSRQVCDVYKAQ